jgi:hypothetical protein
LFSGKLALLVPLDRCTDFGGLIWAKAFLAQALTGEGCKVIVRDFVWLFDGMYEFQIHGSLLCRRFPVHLNIPAHGDDPPCAE